MNGSKNHFPMNAFMTKCCTPDNNTHYSESNTGVAVRENFN